MHRPDRCVRSEVVRRLVLFACTVSAVAAAVLTAPVGATTPTGGFGSPACLRGHWGANQAETKRVLHALVPMRGYEVEGKLYMQFRDGALQYGSTALTIRNTLGDAQMTAKGRFFSLAPYTARPGVLKLGAGRSTVEWGHFTATKDGATFSVPGPAPRTTRTPGGSVPFQCRGNTLRVRLPRIADLDWITLRRG